MPEVRDLGLRFRQHGSAPARWAGAHPRHRGRPVAATVGQGCFKSGMAKSTYGTGRFALLNTGDTPVQSRARLLTTIAYQLEGKRTYALEGAIFIAGAAVQWLRDGLKLISTAAETGTLAAAADPADAVYMVPAFVGLGAPWWDAEARAALYGLSRKSGPPEISRAALESVGYQTRDLLDAMRADWPAAQGANTVLRRRRHDGERLHDAVSLRHPGGAGRPAGLHGNDRRSGRRIRQGAKPASVPISTASPPPGRLDRRFEPKWTRNPRAQWSGWQDAVRRTLTPR